MPALPASFEATGWSSHGPRATAAISVYVPGFQALCWKFTAHADASLHTVGPLGAVDQIPISRRLPHLRSEYFFPAASPGPSSEHASLQALTGVSGVAAACSQVWRGKFLCRHITSKIPSLSGGQREGGRQSPHSESHSHLPAEAAMLATKRGVAGRTCFADPWVTMEVGHILLWSHSRLAPLGCPTVTAGWH